MRNALSLEFRSLIFVNLAVAIVFGFLLSLFPTYTALYAPWVFGHPRSAIVIGVGYLSACVYYSLVLRTNDWVQARNGTLNLVIFSLVLLAATSTDLAAFRLYHPITLAWLFYYYANPLFVPMLSRLQDTEANDDGAILSPLWRGWLIIRGILYLAVALIIFLFAPAVAANWAWSSPFAVDLRVFTGFISVTGLSGIAALWGPNWNRLRLGLVFTGSLGILNLIGLLLNGSDYNFSTSAGMWLPIMFAEWFLTPLVMYFVYRKK